MFNMREYIKKGFINAIGKMADYQIILSSAGWLEKGVLAEEDLVEIQSAIDTKNASLVVEINTNEGLDETTNVENEEVVSDTDEETISEEVE